MVAGELGGEGEAVILIHGWGLSSKIWHGQIEYFSLEKRVITMDLRGHGRERSVSGPYNIKNFTDDLKREIGRLGVERPILIGSSLGGMVVINYLLSSPGEAGAAVLIGTSPCFQKRVGFEGGVSEIVSSRLRRQLLKNSERRMEIFYRQLLSVGKGERDSLGVGVRKEEASYCESPSQGVLLETLGELEKWDVRARLHEIDLPVLILHGSRDDLFTTECARSLGEIKNSRVEIISGGGHLPFINYPEEVNRRVTKFLHSSGFF